MKSKISLLFAVLCFSFQIVSAQTLNTVLVQTVKNVTKKGNDSQISPELKEEAVKLLRETIAEVNTLRTSENRISFATEAASLMWFHDEREGRAMFQTVINDFRQMVARYDAQTNAFGSADDDAESGIYGDNPKSNALRKLMESLELRQQIATVIAEHDPRLALEFYESAAQAVTNPEVRKQINDTDDYYMTALLTQIAENDADVALQYGRKAVAKGLNYGTVSLLTKLYEKDAEKGAALGEEIVKKLKSQADEQELSSSLLTMGDENLTAIKKEGKGKTPMFSEQLMHELADIYGKQLLTREDLYLLDLAAPLALIEKYAPVRAAQIRAKFARRTQSKSDIENTSAQVEKEAAEIESKTKDSKSTQEKLGESLEKLADDKLTTEERQKFINQAREIIASIQNRSQKISLLSGLALRAAQLGDKELASDIMRETGSLISSQPTTYQDYLETWMFASGYAMIDAEKAFPILENTIFRLNDTISAFIKVGEFMDMRGEIIEDGEIKVSGFGGNISKSLLGSLGIAEPIMRSLAVADFTRTKGLATKFDRMEVRIIAKMLILRSILAENKDEPSVEELLKKGV